MILTNEYQYIGRSSGVQAYGSSFYFYLLLYAKASGSTATGKHTVSVKMRLACTVDSTFYGYYTTAHAKVDGSNVFSWNSQQIPNAAWGSGSITEGGVTYPRYTDLKEGTVEVDTKYAQKDITISASWIRDSISGTPPYWLPKNEAVIANITVTLPLIPSASTITSVADVTLGNTCSVKWTPKSASFRYKLKFAIGNWSHTTGAIHPNKNTEHTYSDYSIPIEVANQFETKTGTMTVTLYTYSDSNATAQIGAAHAETFMVTVPENEDTAPKVYMDLSPSSSPFDGLYIQGKSKLIADLYFETKYGAELDSSSLTVDGTAYEDGYLTKAGTVSVKATVKDSRGHYGMAHDEITVIPYSKPIVQAADGESNIVAARCDANGNIKDSGTYLKIKAKLGYEKVISDGTQYNFGKIQYRYRAEGGQWSDWYTILDTELAEETEVTTVALLGGALSIQTNYQVQVKAVDNLEESLPVTLTIASDSVYMHRPVYGKSMGLGGYAQGNGNLDVYWKLKARKGLYLVDAGEELNLGSILPLPRGQLAEGRNLNDIASGIYEVGYPLKDAMGNVLIDNGVLIQLAVTADGSSLIQMAFQTDPSYTPVYRIKQEYSWSDWLSFKI